MDTDFHRLKPQIARLRRKNLCAKDAKRVTQRRRGHAEAQRGTEKRRGKFCVFCTSSVFSVFLSSICVNLCNLWIFIHRLTQIFTDLETTENTESYRKHRSCYFCALCALCAFSVSSVFLSSPATRYSPFAIRHSQFAITLHQGVSAGKRWTKSAPA